MLKKIFFVCLLVQQMAAQSVLPLIPLPEKVTPGNGNFTLDSKTVIVAESGSFEAKFLRDYVESTFGLRLKITSVPAAKGVHVIAFQLQIPDTTAFDSEQYVLDISAERINIAAAASQGQFYAVQTVIQLLPTDKTKSVRIPCLRITDRPKFKWRGMHLDVSRHFFPVDFVKRYIDYLASYKMNTFHWHLTDDQGWRIEIKKYPKLTQVGAWRNGTMVGHYNEQRYDTIKYGGFYTQQQIKEVVAYARERHITVVPEIEMPGHALAALSAYPELACTDGPFEAAKGWGVFEDVFCPKEETFTFLENVLSEVIELFPSEYIHIGGDECPKTRWKSCAHCQGLIRQLGLSDEHELQSYFITRIEKYVNAKGRKIIGWDEILEGGLAPNAAVMSWRGTEGGTAAAKLHHNVVMSPGSHCYFDQYQADPASQTQPIAIGGLITLEKVYSFNPIPEALSEAESKYILGAQANVWTEYILNEDHVEYMVFPRITALAEVLWGTADPAKFNDFTKRLSLHRKRLDTWGVHYCKLPFTN
ncbi:beta-N-acetylhexosaminidase [Flavobacterium magnum]|uniref:beta-N-acetylhexosaminidase n=1 Tax=Flavobacterium magnum TaxID=2162713 RepID=A0A2S0REG0_9FLAO|nr:beta-N-acetylhexosaminidase [Flavobacterium magnum]